MAHPFTAIALAGLMALALLVPSSAAEVASVPEDEPPLLIGTLPTRGGLALVSTSRDASVRAVLAEVEADGCQATLLALTWQGYFLGYVPGAPAFVNAAFPRDLEASSALVIRCAKPPPNVPDLHLLTLVTKSEPLPAELVPAGLVALPVDAVLPGGSTLYLVDEAAEALADLLEAARKEGFDVRVRSAYRSYAEQVATYQYWVSLLGEAVAGQRSARPGHSEHQLGTVVDVTSASISWGLEPELADLPEGRWLARNAWRYGFAESYPAGAEEITGYAYEPWHLRFIGRSNADWLRTSGLTLTEYLTALRDEIE